MTRRTRRIFASALVALVALPAAASAQGGTLPDLVSDPVESPTLQVNTTGGVSRLLLRFNSYIHNAGPGAVEIRGDMTKTPPDVYQAVAGRAQPTLLPGASLVFEDGSLTNEDGHNHWHLQNAAGYSLLDGEGLVAPAEKVGFCLLDSLRVSGTRPRTFNSNCTDATDGTADNVLHMGVSAGWRDLYTSNLAHQYVDVSQTLPGPYTLSAEVDPLGLIEESNESNAPGDLSVTLPGYLAKPRSAQRPSGTEPVTVGLGATAVGPDLDPAEFRLVDPPQNGTVTLGSGWTTDRVVTYTPDGGGATSDAFTYQVREAGSPFPRSPSEATVAIGVGTTPVIAVGGPAEMVAGTSTLLTSDPPAENWDASAGSITREGRFTAPAAEGTVTVTAIAPSGAVARKTVRVLPVPRSEPAPLPPGGPAGEPLPTGPPSIAPPAPVALPRRALGTVKAARVGRFVAVSAVAGQAGRLTITLRKGTRRIKGCVVDVKAGASHSCRIRRPRGERSALKVVVSLRKRAGGTVTRTIALRAAPRARASAHRH